MNGSLQVFGIRIAFLDLFALFGHSHDLNISLQVPESPAPRRDEYLKGYIMCRFNCATVLRHFKSVLTLQDCLGMLGQSLVAKNLDTTVLSMLSMLSMLCLCPATWRGLLDRPPLGHWFGQGSKLLEGPADLHRCIGIGCTVDTTCCPTHCSMRCPTCL